MLSDTVVFWDFDGTLAYRRGGMWGHALYEALKEVSPNTEIVPQLLSAHLRTGFPWHEPSTPHLHLSEPASWWRHMEALLAGVLVKVGVAEPVAAECARVARTNYISPTAWALYDDAVPALTALRGMGVRNIILSNHVPELEWLTAELDLSALLDGVITSALTGYEKPNRRAFEIGLEMAGHPKSAYMVGDNPVADVAGAEATGITGILIARDGERVSGVRAVECLTEIPAHISN